MIRVSLTALLLIYLAGMLVLICMVWIGAEWRRRVRERHALRHLLHCTFCSFEFEDSSEALLPRCPRCSSRNERAQRVPL